MSVKPMSVLKIYTRILIDLYVSSHVKIWFLYQTYGSGSTFVFKEAYAGYLLR